MYKIDCVFEVATRNLVDRDPCKQAVLNKVLCSLAASNWTSAADNQTVLHCIITACSKAVLSNKVAVALAEAVVNEVPALLGSRDDAGKDAVSLASGEGAENCVALLAKLSELASTQFFHRFIIQDDGHPVKLTPTGTHIVSHGIIIIRPSSPFRPNMYSLSARARTPGVCMCAFWPSLPLYASTVSSSTPMLGCTART